MYVTVLSSLLLHMGHPLSVLFDKTILSLEDYLLVWGGQDRWPLMALVYFPWRCISSSVTIVFLYTGVNTVGGPVVTLHTFILNALKSSPHMKQYHLFHIYMRRMVCENAIR